MSATLGGLIKDYRLQKNISQHDIAFALGWKEPSRLSRIEQGKVEKPPREIIEKIIEALELKEEEKNTLLLVGNYLPTDEEIRKIRKETKELLDNWLYPANILDFSWRVIEENKANIKIYQVDKKLQDKIDNEYLRVIEVLFNPDFFLNKNLSVEGEEKWHSFLKEIILQFRYEQRNRTNESWYIQHIKTMMNNDLFRKLWVESKEAYRSEAMLGKFAQKSIPSPENPQKILNFYLFVTPILHDPRFEMERLIPSDLETYLYFHKNKL